MNIKEFVKIDKHYSPLHHLHTHTSDVNMRTKMLFHLASFLVFMNTNISEKPQLELFHQFTYESKVPTQTGTSTSVNSKQQLFYNYEVTLANDLHVDNHSMLFYHMKYSRPPLCFQPINISQRCHRLMIILIISGDISLNPGPVKNPCGLCHKTSC